MYVQVNAVTESPPGAVSCLNDLTELSDGLTVLQLAEKVWVLVSCLSKSGLLFILWTWKQLLLDVNEEEYVFSLPSFVCLSVFSLFARLLKKLWTYEKILLKFCKGGAYIAQGHWTKYLDFGDDPDHDLDPETC